MYVRGNSQFPDWFSQSVCSLSMPHLVRMMVTVSGQKLLAALQPQLMERKLLKVKIIKYNQFLIQSIKIFLTKREALSGYFGGSSPSGHYFIKTK